MILLVVPAVVIASVSLAAFAGRWVWWLDVLANFRPQYFVVLTVLGVAVAASARWRRVGLAVLAVALLNLILVAPLYVTSPDPAVAGSPTLEVINFNLLSGNTNFSEVVSFLSASDADLVLLHEASRPWEVALEAADLPYEMIRGRSDQLIFGTLALVRWPTEAVSYGFAADQPRAMALALQPDGWPEPVSVLAVHTLAPSTEKRALLRNSQLGFAANWAKQRQGAYLVVGDFNATPWSWAFRRLLDGTGLRNSQLGFGLQASFPVTSNPLIRVPIDHLLVSDSLRIRSRELGPSLGSDHFPLIVELEYAGEGAR